jgi:hypothetical protein
MNETARRTKILPFVGLETRQICGSSVRMFVWSWVHVYMLGCDGWMDIFCMYMSLTLPTFFWFTNSSCCYRHLSGRSRPDFRQLRSLRSLQRRRVERGRLFARDRHLLGERDQQYRDLSAAGILPITNILHRSTNTRLHFPLHSRRPILFRRRPGT